MSSTPGGVWARWGLLAIATLLAATLIFASLVNYKSARDASMTLHMGQSRIFESAILHAIFQLEDDSAITAELMQTVIDERSEEGLRYLALLDEDGEIELSAGEPSPEPMILSPSDERGKRFELTELDSRIRLVAHRPPPPRLERDRDMQRERRRHGIVIEFDPIVADTLNRRASRLLVFGLVTAVAMMAAAVISWRLVGRYNAGMLQIERERHLGLLGRMSAVLAHEIRNPLASLKGNAQLLAEKLAAETPDRRKADRVVHEATRLEALTTDLLDFARTGSVEREPVDPLVLVQETIAEVDSDGFQLIVDRSPARWPLDARRFRQVLTNLFRNAKDASPPGSPKPAVTIDTDTRSLVVSVRDFGEGLPEGEEERIFEPFYTTRTSGTGLGLSVARHIVDLHGGRLMAGNHEEGGTVFRIEIPGESG